MGSGNGGCHTSKGRYMSEDYERGRDHERMEILKLLREQRKFWKDWEYPEEYIFAVDVLMERIKCKPTSK